MVTPMASLPGLAYEQVLCFANAAAHLEPGGFLVGEAFIPELQRLPRGDTYRAFTVTPGYFGFDEYDIANQLCTSHHYFNNQGQIRYFASRHRCVWPSELDLMARLALHERWGRLEPHALHQRSQGSCLRLAKAGVKG
jgi:hypothetical protein